MAVWEDALPQEVTLRWQLNKGVFLLLVWNCSCPLPSSGKGWYLSPMETSVGLLLSVLGSLSTVSLCPRLRFAL